MEALQEIYQKAFVMNITQLDSDRDMTSTLRHEALYGAYVLTFNIEPNWGLEHDPHEPHPIDSLDEIEEAIDLFNDYIDYPMEVNGNIYTYGVCLLNKWCGFSDIKINTTINKKMTNYLSYMIYSDSETNQEYYDRLTELNRKILMFISITTHTPSFDLSEMNNLITSDMETLLNKLPDNNIELGYYINESLVDRCLDNVNPSSDLYKLYSSGTRFGKQQLAKTIVSTGYISDDENYVNLQPIRSNLMSGMTEYEFFMSSPGCRKG